MWLQNKKLKLNKIIILKHHFWHSPRQQFLEEIKFNDHNKLQVELFTDKDKTNSMADGGS